MDQYTNSPVHHYIDWQGSRLAKILLAEDDLLVAEAVTDALCSENHTVEAVISGEEAADRLKLYDYDLVILDWGLPGQTGIQVLRNYRSRGGHLPVLMLTGKNQEESRVEGLDSGADDYLCKPFSLRELSARVRSLLRRPEKIVSGDLRVGPLTIYPGKLKVLRDGEEIALLAKEMAVLEFLARHRGQAYTVDDLLNKVWHSESDSTEDAVRQCITRLRKKIDKGPDSIIKTMRNAGYMVE